MAYMKYIKGENGTVVIFSQNLTHKHVSECLGIKVKSAGSVSMVDDQISVFGESITLSNRPESGDSAMIKRQLDVYDGT